VGCLTPNCKNDGGEKNLVRGCRDNHRGGRGKQIQEVGNAGRDVWIVVGGWFHFLAKERGNLFAPGGRRERNKKEREIKGSQKGKDRKGHDK